MEILGDSNATLKDLTRIVEAEIMEPRTMLHPLICSEVESADEAYIKIPVQTRVPFPTLFDGERAPTGTEVNVVQQYNKATYALTMDYGSDLMKESKAYTFSEKTQEGTLSAKIFPNWNLTKNVIIGNVNAYDGKAFYANNHLWANTGTNTINNTVSKTGQTPTALMTDLNTAFAQMGTFLDNQGRLLNPLLAWGSKNLIIHCPLALEMAFRQVIFSSIVPIAIPGTASSAMAATAWKDLGLDGIAQIYADGYLDAASTTTWYLHYVGMPQRPFVFSESYGLIAKALGFGSEFETRRNQVEIDLKHRFVEGVYRFDRSIKVA
jgi:hypothetical protein